MCHVWPCLLSSGAECSALPGSSAASAELQSASPGNHTCGAAPGVSLPEFPIDRDYTAALLRVPEVVQIFRAVIHVPILPTTSYYKCRKRKARSSISCCMCCERSAGYSVSNNLRSVTTHADREIHVLKEKCRFFRQSVYVKSVLLSRHEKSGDHQDVCQVAHRCNSSCILPVNTVPHTA